MDESTEDRGDDLEERAELAEQTLIRLLHLADEARRRLDDFFQPFGLTGQQHAVLRILSEAGEPLPTMEVADRMPEKTPGLTGILDRLQDKDLVTRRRSDADRRVWLCALSERGLALLDEIEEPLRAARLKALGDPSAVELQVLGHTLGRILRD